MTLVSVIVVAALTWYILTPAERERAGRALALRITRLRPVAAALVRAFRREPSEMLDAALRERAWPLVTLSLAALNVGVYAWSHLDPAAPVVDILGNVAARTADGEWWRLLTAIAVHPGLVHLLVNTLALVQVGLVLERLVGSPSFAAVYAVSGVFAGLYAVSGFDASPALGASGAMFGIYGLLVATWMWGTLQRAETTLRLGTVKAFAPMGALFAVTSLTTSSLPAAAEGLALATGFVCGVMMTRPARLGTTPARRVATVMAAGAYLAIVAAVPLAGTTDPRPVLAHVFEAEKQTSVTYGAALNEFHKGRLDQKELARVVEQQILPVLLSVRTDLQQADRPPRELLPLVRAAEVYTLRRIESWRIRAEALRDGNARRLREAEAVERAALERLRSIPTVP